MGLASTEAGEGDPSLRKCPLLLSSTQTLYYDFEVRNLPGPVCVWLWLWAIMCVCVCVCKVAVGIESLADSQSPGKDETEAQENEWSSWLARWLML